MPASTPGRPGSYVYVLWHTCVGTRSGFGLRHSVRTCSQCSLGLGGRMGTLAAASTCLLSGECWMVRLCLTFKPRLNRAWSSTKSMLCSFSTCIPTRHPSQYEWWQFVCGSRMVDRREGPPMAQLCVCSICCACMAVHTLFSCMVGYMSACNVRPPLTCTACMHVSGPGVGRLHLHVRALFMQTRWFGVLNPSV
jgi:hypothetical protein